MMHKTMLSRWVPTVILGDGKRCAGGAHNMHVVSSAYTGCDTQGTHASHRNIETQPRESRGAHGALNLPAMVIGNAQGAAVISSGSAFVHYA